MPRVPGECLWPTRPVPGYGLFGASQFVAVDALPRTSFGKLCEPPWRGDAVTR